MVGRYIVFYEKYILHLFFSHNMLLEIGVYTDITKSLWISMYIYKCAIVRVLFGSESYFWWEICTALLEIAFAYPS